MNVSHKRIQSKMVCHRNDTIGRNGIPYRLQTVPVPPKRGFNFTPCSHMLLQQCLHFSVCVEVSMLGERVSVCGGASVCVCVCVCVCLSVCL